MNEAKAKPMGKEMEISLEHRMEELKRDLRSFVPEGPTSHRQIVVETRAEILEARRNGASWEQIAARFRQRGFDIPADTIRRYCEAAVPSRPMRAVRRKKASSMPSTADQTANAEKPDASDVRSSTSSHISLSTEASSAGKPVIARRLD